MKITAIKSFLVYPYHIRNPLGWGQRWLHQKYWLLLKVETDEGFTGWGEAYTQSVPREKSVAQHVTDIIPYLIGRNPFHIKHFTQIAYNDFAGRRGAMDFFCAVSGIEHALWDIVGKSLDTPIYNLLGGPCRDRIRVYANGWYNGVNDPEELAQRAVETVKMGFTALKFDPFLGPWRLFISKKDERVAVRNVQAVREAVGPDIDILVEVHRRLAPIHAIRVARMMEEFDPFWYEEPVPSENLDALARVRQAIKLPVVTGETMYTKAAFREVLEKQAADILNPDVASCGGILELKEIAAMAEPYYVAICPHNYNSTTVGLAATIQAVATIPNFIITEYFVNFTDMGNSISMPPFRLEEGYIKLPTTPGLGLEINEEALKKYPFREFPLPSFRSYEEEEQ